MSIWIDEQAGMNFYMVFFIFKNKNAINLVPFLELFLTMYGTEVLYVPSALILHLCTFSTEFINMFIWLSVQTEIMSLSCTNQVVSVILVVFSVRQEINVYLDKLQASEAKGTLHVSMCVCVCVCVCV